MAQGLGTLLPMWKTQMELLALEPGPALAIVAIWGRGGKSMSSGWTISVTVFEINTETTTLQQGWWLDREQSRHAPGLLPLPFLHSLNRAPWKKPTHAALGFPVWPSSLPKAPQRTMWPPGLLRL